MLRPGGGDRPPLLTNPNLVTATSARRPVRDHQSRSPRRADRPDGIGVALGEKLLGRVCHHGLSLFIRSSGHDGPTHHTCPREESILRHSLGNPRDRCDSECKRLSEPLTSPTAGIARCWAAPSRLTVSICHPI